MSEWKKVRLGDVAVMKRGKYITRSDTRPGNIPVILGGQEPAYYCDEANHTGPCIVISRSGASAGFVSYWQQPIFVTDGFLFEANEQSNIHYLYYCLNANQSLLGNLQNATAIPHVRGEDLKAFEISLPPLPTQRKIAAVLGALDDKIENNRKICANLEAQAQAIFKSWFVDFEPFGGKMPQGWKMGKISSVFQLARDSVKAGERPDLPYLPIDMLPMHSFFVNSYLPNEDAQSSLILFKKWDVLIGAMRVYFHRVLPAPCDGITRTTCFVLRSIKDCYREFGLMAINQDEAITFAQQTSKGSTMPYAVWEGGLADYETVIPDEKAAENFSRLLRNLIEEEQSLAKESSALAEMRDALLPKLMSGEIDVEKVEVQEVVK